MSENTKIEWADHSWSPWRGCTKISPGCANCYAEKLSRRNPAVLGQWGRGAPRVLAKNWGDPMRWEKRARENAEGADREASASLGEFSELMVSEPPRVFPSLCDWLDEEVPVGWLAMFLALVNLTPHLDWLLLTKRPENWRERIDSAALASTEFHQRWLVEWLKGNPPPNVWFGVSVEDQMRADERIPVLLGIPARVRWLSLEPLLGPVELSEWIHINTKVEPGDDGHGVESFIGQQLHWLVVGGESGTGARPCLVEWIRSLIYQGCDAGVPTFVKQLGARPLLRPCRQHHFDWRHNTANATRPDDKLFVEAGELWRVLLSHPKGGDPAEWPEHLRVREFPKEKGGAS